MTKLELGNFKPIYIIQYLFVFLPFALITGPFLPDLFLSVISIFGIYCLFLTEFRRKYFFNPFIILLVLFYSYIVFCSLLSSNIFFSFQSSLFYIRYPLFIFGAVCLIHKNSKLIKYFAKVVIASVLIILFDIIFELIFGFNTLGNISPAKSIGRFSSFFGDELILGKYISLIFLYGFLIFTFNTKDKKISLKNQILLILYVSISFALIYLSGERTAFFYFLIIIIFILLSNIFILKLKLILIIIPILSLIVLTIISPSSKERLVNSTILQIIDKNSDTININFFSKVHELHFETAIKMFKQNKYVGIGPKIFRLECDYENYISLSDEDLSQNFDTQNGCSTHPHNYYLQLLAETGFFGFMMIIYFFLTSVVYLSKTLIQNTKYSFNLYLLYLIVFVNFYPIVPTVNFFNNWISVLIYLPFPFLIYLKNLNKN